MAAAESTARIVEEFLLRREAEPGLDLESFIREAGDVPEAARRAIERWLRIEASLAGFHGGGGVDLGTRDEEPDEFVGTTLGDFTIRRVLGRGGTGTVYLAQRGADERLVALKLLHPVLIAEPAQRERFRREASILQRLDHPHIARLIEAGEAEGCVFHAIEFIEGESLDRILRRRRDEGATAPDAMTVARLGTALASALDHAHAHGLIHRDLKPGNVIAGRDGHPWLIDFGLARDLARSRVTLSGHVVGTPVYMAPEQLDPSLGPVDARTDVFGLGLTLAEFASGVSPRSDAPWQEPLRRMVAHSLPRDLGTVLLRAVEVDPRRRYPDAAEFREDLERVILDEPVRARRAGLLRRTRMAIRRHPVLSASLGILLAAAVVVTILLLRQAWRDAEAAGDHLASAEGALDRDDLLAAESELARARALGASVVNLDDRLRRRSAHRAAEESLDVARAIIFDARAGRAALDQAAGLCVEAARVLEGASAFDPWVLRALIAFRCRDADAAEAAVRSAMKARDLAIPEELVDKFRVLAFRILAANAGSGVVGIFRPASAVEAADLELVTQIDEATQGLVAESAELAFIIGTVFFGLDRQTEAIRCFDRVLAKTPANASALWMKAQCYLAGRNYDAAKEMARLAETTTQGSVASRFLLGVVAFENKEDDEAIAAFAEVEARNPALWEAARYRGEALVRLERHEEAERAFDRVLEAMPAFGDAYALRGTARFKQKKYEEALADLAEAGRLAATDVNGVILTRAACHAQLGRAAEALEAAGEALANDRSLPWAWWWRAMALQLLDQLTESADAASTAARLAARLGIPQLEERALRADAATKRAAVNSAETVAESASSLRTLLDADLPWLLLDETDAARRLRLLEILGEDRDSEPVFAFLRATYAAADSYASSPPSGITVAQARREMAKALKQFVQRIRSARHLEDLRGLAGILDVLQEGLDLCDRL